MAKHRMWLVSIGVAAVIGQIGCQAPAVLWISSELREPVGFRAGNISADLAPGERMAVNTSLLRQLACAPAVDVSPGCRHLELEVQVGSDAQATLIDIDFLSVSSRLGERTRKLLVSFVPGQCNGEVEESVEIGGGQSWCAVISTD
jgi:hypothetical protein